VLNPTLSRTNLANYIEIYKNGAFLNRDRQMEKGNT
jgi:hypothetical protein